MRKYNPIALFSFSLLKDKDLDGLLMTCQKSNALSAGYPPLETWKDFRPLATT